jgi:hypothetical protein
MFQMTRWNALRASPRERSRPGPIAHRLGTTAAGPFKPLTEYLCIDGAPRASLQPKAERLRERAFGKLFWQPTFRRKEWLWNLTRKAHWRRRCERTL